MSACRIGKREKYRIAITALQADINTARQYFSNGAILEAIDIYEQLAVAYPAEEITILAELFDCYQQLPNRDRYNLYQSRHFNFGIVQGDKVLDIGSGHLPFPLATHLADIAVTDHAYGRAGTPFKYIDDKPVYECSVESMPFGDKEFDFVYCSHVLEHTTNPEKACQELMRIGKRGYIETPTKGKDIFLNSAKVSNHTQYIELYNNTLIFTDYTPEEQDGLQCDILLQMNCNPQTIREKAFAALMLLKSDLINTMLLWDGGFDFEVRYTKPTSIAQVEPTEQINHSQHSNVIFEGKDVSAKPAPLKFMQAHIFYPHYLDTFYSTFPELSTAPFIDQVNAIVRDGFGAIHMFAPYMTDLGYESHLVIANNRHAQHKWLNENGAVLSNTGDWIKEITRKQIELIKPDILYLTDPVGLDSSFIRSLSWKPSLILGWKASDIPEGTDWSEFDVLMSNLSAMRAMALKLGARSAEHFSPGYPAWINSLTEDIVPQHDVVFTGSWTWTQHQQRNRLLQLVARESLASSGGFSCGYYISGDPATITPEVAALNMGGRFGIAMHRVLKSGRIILDARGSLEFKNGAGEAKADLAVKETSNMRILEATGSGVFLLTEHFDNLSSYFEPGTEIETFRDEKELLDKIRYYLAHPDEREAIALRGQARCLRDYSIEKRTIELDQIIKKHIVSKNDADKKMATKLLPPLKSEPASLFNSISSNKVALNYLATMGSPLYSASEAGGFAKEVMLSPRGVGIRSLLPNFKPVCRLFPRGIFILSDGSVTTCCLDPYGKNTFGSVYSTSLANIWRSTVSDIVHGDLYDLPACRECIGSSATSITSTPEETLEWQETAASYPEFIQIEIMGACNYGCCISPSLHHYRKATKPDLDAIFYQIKDFLPGVKQLNLFNYGEPLLHDGFVRFISQCRQRSDSLIFHVATNGMLLDENYAKAFIELRVNRVIVSVHGGPGTENMLKYSKYGANYEQVLANIERLLVLRNESGIKFPRISLKAILFNWNDNDADMNRFRADARKLGLKADLSPDADNYYWILNSADANISSTRYKEGSLDLQRLSESNEF